MPSIKKKHAFFRITFKCKNLAVLCNFSSGSSNSFVVSLKMKIMKKLIFAIFPGLVLSLCYRHSVEAQTLSPEVIATAGERFDLPGEGSLEWTLGETMVETLTEQSFLLTQGFHQSYFVVDAWRNSEFEFQIQVFPNPTPDWLYLETDAPHQLSIELVDMMGRVLLEKKVSQQGQLYLGDFADGLFLLRIFDDKQTLRVLKIRACLNF